MPSASVAPAPGRTKQKERTRQALLAAARALVAEGSQLSIARIAEHAVISEPTAYRYYSSLPELLRDALSPQWPELPKLLVNIAAAKDARDRAELAAKALATEVLRNEAAIRALISVSYADPASRKPRGVGRPHFRTVLIDAILEGQGERLGTNEKRLRLALAAMISGEAVLGLKDAQRCSNRDAVAAIAWSARQLVSAALA